MVIIKYMILFINLIVFINSCIQKNPHPTGGFQDIVVKKNTTTGFGGSDGQKIPDPQFLYMDGCYSGTMQGVENNPNAINLFLDARQIDKDGWGKNNQSKIILGLMGNFNQQFNISSNKCIRFSHSVTEQKIEYFMDEAGDLGANISAELENFDSRPIESGCELFGHPVRLDIRILFNKTPHDIVYKDGQIKKTKAIYFSGGSYTLYYANIQKAYETSDQTGGRAENPRFCCPNPDSEAWTNYINQTQESYCNSITLDKKEHLAYFTGYISSFGPDQTCTSNDECATKAY